jgi:hypothetical protein
MTSSDYAFSVTTTGIESRTDENDCVRQNSNLLVAMFIKSVENSFYDGVH